MPAFPASLPAPVWRGYGVRPGDALARTDVEQGPARQRRRFTAIPYILPVVWEFTDDEFDAFETFWRDTLQHGAAWFDCVLLDGRGLTTQEVRFSAPWQAAPIGFDYWTVTAVLERRAA